MEHVALTGERPPEFKTRAIDLCSSRDARSPSGPEAVRKGVGLSKPSAILAERCPRSLLTTSAIQLGKASFVDWLAVADQAGLGVSGTRLATRPAVSPTSRQLS